MLPQAYFLFDVEAQQPVSCVLDEIVPADPKVLEHGWRNALPFGLKDGSLSVSQV